MNCLCRFQLRVTLAAFFVVCSAVSTAEEFPKTARRLSGAELLDLMQRAPEERMIITDVRARSSGQRIVYNADFEENSDETAWVFLVNVDRERLNDATKEYADKGYELTIRRSASAGGKRFYTGIWTRRKQEAQALVLPDGPIPISGRSHPNLDPLDAMVAAFLKEHNAAGATVAVAKNGRLLYSRGFGYADITTLEEMQPDSVMRIASVSKPITAVAILMLVEQGRLTLETPVASLLKSTDFPQQTGDARWDKITVRHLLNHSGGWDRDASKDPMFQVIEATNALKLKSAARQSDIIRWKLSQPLDFDPGEKYVYSNFGYCILGRLVEIVSEMSYSDWVAENILTPRGMRRSRLGTTRLSDRGPSEVRYHQQQRTMHSPYWANLQGTARRGFPDVTKVVEEPYGRWDLEVMDSHGGWVSTAPDLLRFVGGLAAADSPLISAESRDVMLSKPEFRKASQGSSWYGCGWSVRSAGRGESMLDHHNIWHNGALAGTSTLLVRRWDGFSWAVLFNTRDSKSGRRLSSVIDSKMHRAVDSIAEWPDQ